MEIDAYGVKLNGSKIWAIMIALSAVIGILYGAFVAYKEYNDLKSMMDPAFLGELEKKLAIIEETNNKTADYVRDIKNDMKQDIRKVEQVVETVERDTKNRQREMDKDIRELREETDLKIKKALENPLAAMGTAN